MLPQSIDEVPPPPREPSPRARALIFARRPGQSAMLFAGIFLLVLGSVFGVVFGGQVPQDLLIDLHPVHEQGTLVSRHVDRQKSNNGVHPTVLRFSYVHEGQRYEAESSAMRHVPSVEPGDSLEVEVARDRPSYARVVGTLRSWCGYFGGIALLIPLVGLFVIFKALTLQRNGVRAFTDGVPAVAEVVFAGVDMRTRINGRRPWIVKWKFALDGVVHRGSLSTMDKPALEELMAAKTLVVLYDPAKPGCNTVFIGE